MGVETRFKVYGAAYPDPDRVPSGWARPGTYGSIGDYERDDTANIEPGFERKRRFYWCARNSARGSGMRSTAAARTTGNQWAGTSPPGMPRPFFVSVSAPLLKREEHEINHEDRLKEDMAILEAGIIVPGEHDIAGPGLHKYRSRNPLDLF